MGTSTTQEAQLQYLKNVLGIEHITLPLGHAIPTQTKTEAKYQLGFFEFRRGNQGSVSLSYPEDTLALFQKMVEAMKLKWDFTTYCLYHGADEEAHKYLQGWLHKHQLRTVVLFGDETISMWLKRSTSVQEERTHGGTIDATKYYVTFSPNDLLASPQNKRDCWQDLQRIMRELR